MNMVCDKKQKKKTKIIKSKIKDYITLLQDKNIKILSGFITADIETFVYNGKQYPYSIGFYIHDKNLYKAFFLPDYIDTNDSNEKIIEKSNLLVISFLNDLNKQNTNANLFSQSCTL